VVSADKPPLLYLVHRIPYPPNKGDKIRSWHILRELSRHFSVYLGTFVDDPDDWAHCPLLRRHCIDTCFVARSPRLHKLLAARGLLSGTALSVDYYRSRELQAWVDRVVTRAGIDRALLFCSPMARFVAPDTVAGQRLTRVVMDLVDVDSEKWRQYAGQRRGVGHWLYRREAATLLAHEQAASARCDVTFLVSRQEADLYRARAPALAERISHFPNGVDTDYFQPDARLPNPYGNDNGNGNRALVFTGAMDYPPNVEAASSFARDIFPALKARHADLQFWIVGGKPTAGVQALAAAEGVHVTGRVPDVRPYLQHALAAVAPLRIARGVQNKVLEAMAMATPIMASAEAFTGIDLPATADVHPVTSVDEHLALLERLSDQHSVSRETDALRAWAVDHFAWDATLDTLRRSLA